MNEETEETKVWNRMPVPPEQYRWKGVWVAVFAILLAILMLGPLASVGSAVTTTAVTPLDPNTIPKFATQITGPPPVFVPTKAYDPKTGLLTDYYAVQMSQFKEQILPAGYPKTTVWGYGGLAKDAVTGASLGFVRNSPGPSFEAKVGTPINVKWSNMIFQPSMFAVDPTIHWANPRLMTMPTMPFLPYPSGYFMAQSTVPLVTHLHGGETQSYYDGGPEQWMTSSGLKGPDYATYTPTTANSAWYHYDNAQEPTTLWYHDHALGMTRTNVMSGLAGFYLLRDPSDPLASMLPSGKYEVPLVIQDRMFNSDGSMIFPSDSEVPDIHPYWKPEFFGNTIMVNGVVWPNMNVDQGQYRFRWLDGSNARFYNLSFEVQGTGQLLPFVQIGSDGGYLQSAVAMNSVLIAPGERYDMLVDFSGLTAGTKVIVKNDANAPFPDGDPVDANTGVIMQYTVTGNTGFTAQVLPASLNPTLPAGPFPTLDANQVTTIRYLTLMEIMDMNTGNPMMVTLNGQMWDAPISETPTVGTTEEWVIINLTGDTHPIHLHLVQFQLVSRQAFDVTTYTNDWLAMNGEPPYMMTPMTFAPDAYLTAGTLIGPTASESGWKDTIQMSPGEVTTIIVRFAQQDGGPVPVRCHQGTWIRMALPHPGP